MKIDDALKPLLNSRLMAYLTRPRPRLANPLFPTSTTPGKERNRENYIFADDPRMLRAAEEIGDTATREFPSKFFDNGFCDGTGVPGDFNSVRCVSGIGQDPQPLPLVDNAKLVEAAGLASALRAEDRPWMEELVRLFFGAAVPADLHIRAKATTSAPDFQKDGVQGMEYKKLGTLKILKSMRVVLALFMKGEYITLLNEFRVLFLYVMQSRAQPDRVYQENGVWKTKERLAPTVEEARGGLAAKTAADKRAFNWQGSEIPGHFAMRLRDVFGLSGLLNYTISAVMGCFRAVYLQRFAATYKTRGAEDKRARIEKYKYVVGSDVKTMDKLIPRWFMDELCVMLTKYLDDNFVALLRKAFKSPFVAAPNGTMYGDDFNPLFGGNPLDPRFDNHPGLPSGIAINPDIGKLWMTFNYALVYRDCGALSSPSELEAWLAGDNPDHALQDMADDAAMLTNSATVAAKMYAAKSPYVILEVEKPVVFLGDVYCLEGGRKLVYPNPVTYVVNTIAREDDMSKVPLPQWATGILARELLYSKAPIYRDLSRLVSLTYRKHLGFDPNQLAKKVSMPLTGESEADLMFRLNPDSIHYKVDPEDVSPTLLNASVATLSAEDWWDDIRYLFKVRTAPYAASKDEAADLKRQSKEKMA